MSADMERMLLDGLDKFHRIVREERLFCAVLAHLLMQKGRNLESFLELVGGKLPPESKVAPAKPSEAQVYVEFSFLRDRWDGLGGDNEVKRQTVFDLLGRVEGLSRYRPADFPDGVAEFNEYFAGPWARRIRRDIVYPGRWSVAVLAERFGHNPDVFRNFCRFKWSFNIKPDVVVLVPGVRPICVEAKLESGEGQYPKSSDERRLFDDVFGRGKRRVGQVELQRFMFECLLGAPCQIVTVGLAGGRNEDAVALGWREVFKALDLDRSRPFVRKLVEENLHLS